MISHKIKALKTTLSLASSGKVVSNKGFIALVQRQLSDIHEGVLALEQAQVPCSVRLPASLKAAARLPVMGLPANDRRAS